nr:DUF6169 family protein [uncultured Dyadobacter sp.]
MQEESDLLNPYEIVTDDYDRYWFLTESGVCYTAAFVKSSGYFYHYPQFDDKVATFSFRPYELQNPVTFESIPKNGSRYSRARIRDTIIFLLLDFFRAYPEKSIIVICESCDELGECRQRLFDRWFRNASDLVPHSISKYDSTFAGEGYGSILIDNHNPHHELIRDAFTGIPSSDK